MVSTYERRVYVLMKVKPSHGSFVKGSIHFALFRLLVCFVCLFLEGRGLFPLFPKAYGTDLGTSLILSAFRETSSGEGQITNESQGLGSPRTTGAGRRSCETQNAWNLRGLYRIGLQVPGHSAPRGRNLARRLRMGL